MRRYHIEVKGKEYVIDIQELSANQFRAIFADQAFEVQITSDEDLAEARISPSMIPLRTEDEAVVDRPTASYRPPDPDTLGPSRRVPSPAQPPKPDLEGKLRTEVTAPMPGVIQAVEVKVGDEVKHGQTVVVLEAMKMKNAIRSPRDGVVSEVLVRVGQSVGYGDVLVKFGEV
jgi:glutaconyl-CoA/methylmalonyl-CoA decarboxylase subunit gamma